MESSKLSVTRLVHFLERRKCRLWIGKNPGVWMISLEGTGDNPTQTECHANSRIRIGYGHYGETLLDSYEKGNNGRNILNAINQRTKQNIILRRVEQ